MQTRNGARYGSRWSLASLLVAGALTALATALGAGDRPSAPPPSDQPSDVLSKTGGEIRTEADKELVNQRMLEIGQRVGELRSLPSTSEIERSLQQLIREYQSLSAKLGGDDPAHLGVAGSSQPAAAAQNPAAGGGIATTPAAPGGCVATTTTFNNSTPVAIPNTSPANLLVTSQIIVSGVGTFLWDLNLRTFILHPTCPDLDITLTSPAGTVVTITTDNGSGANNFNGTLWDDDADPDGQVPYASNNGLATDQAYAASTLATPLVPEEAMGAFFGEDPNGTWTLTISDDTTNSSNGTLTSWTLEVGTVAVAPTVTPSTTASTDVPKAISATGTPTVSSTVLVSGLGTVITDVNLTTGLTHAFCADIDMTLTSPAGTVVTLTTDNGGSFANVFNGTVWDDDANPLGQVPYANNNGVASDHTYANLALASPLVPEDALAAFIGEDPNGTWTLTISDDAAGSAGSLNSWSLDIGTTTSLPPVTTTNFSLAPGLAIDNLPPVVVTSTINVSGAGPYLWDLDLATTIAHTANGDLDITLTSPAGTVVTITTDNGGTNDNVFISSNGLVGTTWDDDADPLSTVPYANPVKIVTDASYVNNTHLTPLVVEEALGAFIGENPNGTWTLTIHDDAPTVDTGSLNAWSLTVTTIGQAPTGTLTSPSNVTPVAIAAGTINTITSTIVVSGAPTFISDVNAITNITHSFSSDIDMTLTSPAGTVVTLTTDNGGGNDNVFAGTTWDDDADPSGVVPQVGNSNVASDHTYADLTVASPLVPEEAMAAFIGEDPNGTWTLTISDDTASSGGTLNSWSLQITTCACLPPPCPADTNGDLLVNVTDLLAVIGQWGPCVGCPPVHCTGDVAPVGPRQGDCQINVSDLLLVIGAWGACP